ncbi:hypothetical protein ASD55_11800 [Rhodanobacter sp. Root561]|uniref:DUF3606 domain-containing protein n=1 Tax=Rhodanobacter sp. Root561 TaxID=1736560 RepID=UPI0006F1F903|nr:DUF3606 domain-containing protein [Rhodanobacter sp. Root561]KQZ70962.1 hypothetical protein ASD55_11800 [Rhodanobacter sp. Root561]
MDEHIDMDSPLCRAYWCGNFSCSDAELAQAVSIMDTTVVGLVGLYLATRSPELRNVDQHELAENA